MPFPLPRAASLCDEPRRPLMQRGLEVDVLAGPSWRHGQPRHGGRRLPPSARRRGSMVGPWLFTQGAARSEERRVGEEGRSRWAADHLKKKNNATPVTHDRMMIGTAKFDIKTSLVLYEFPLIITMHQQLRYRRTDLGH